MIDSIVVEQVGRSGRISQIVVMIAIVVVVVVVEVEVVSSSSSSSSTRTDVVAGVAMVVTDAVLCRGRQVETQRERNDRCTCKSCEERGCTTY